MWNKKTPRERDPVAENLDLSMDGDVDVDNILLTLYKLIEQTHAFVSLLLNRPEITDLPALEAICFLAVVEDQIGLDDETLVNCLTLLKVSPKKLWTMTFIIQHIWGIPAADFMEFIVAFTKKLRTKLETKPRGYNLNAN